MSDNPDALTGHLHRRRLLHGLAVVGVVPLAACGDVLGEPVGDPGSPAAVDPDETLLADAVRAEAVMAGRLRSLLVSAPRRLHGDLRRTLRVHVAHLRLLLSDGELPTAGGDGLRVAGLVAAEERLARRHTGLAVRADSGQFARVLAGMAAASAQQADLWRGRT